jgi:tetratricopeptide (TPR) repeat protein
MLTNLKAIYFNNQEYGKALSIADRLVILHPHAAGEIRDRGLLSFQVKRYTEASADLERYLRLAPQAEDSEVIREHLRTLRQRVVSLNASADGSHRRAAGDMPPPTSRTSHPANGNARPGPHSGAGRAISLGRRS